MTGIGPHSQRLPESFPKCPNEKKTEKGDPRLNRFGEVIKKSREGSDSRAPLKDRIRKEDQKHGKRESTPISKIDPHYETRKKSKGHSKVVQLQEGCGNKHRNLQLMHNIICDAGLEGVRVPLPFGLSDERVTTYLKMRAPEIETLWEQFVRLAETRAPDEQSLAFLQREEVVTLLSGIREKIQAAFLNHEEALTLLDPDGQLEQWLYELGEQGSYLMVRSTGDEDSTYANAGGNESLAYIQPNLDEALKAVGRVAASYYSQSSFANRMNARDNVSARQPKSPVLLQELVGERIGGADIPEDVPVSITLFSNEPDYGGNENFRIMRCSATYGHGKAVVANLGIPNDTFYVLQSRTNPEELYIVSDLKEKPQRLAPVATEQGIKLESLDNDPSQIHQPSLSKTLLRRLLHLGKVVEAGYGNHPQDMELVIRGNIIYPVQTRPVNRLKQQATYVSREALNKVPPADLISGRTQVAGRGQVVRIYSPDEVLIGTTLESCQEKYKHGHHKIVVYQQLEPNNSHPIVNFSGLGIPCIQIKNTEAAQQLVGRTGTDISILADVQCGKLLLWNEKDEDPILDGWAQHPANLQISLALPSMLRAPYGELSKQELIPLSILIERIHMIQTAEEAQATIKDLFFHPTLQRLSEKRSALASWQPKSLRGRVTVGAVAQLDKRITKAAKEYLGAFQSMKSCRLEILFHAGVLKNLFVQESGDSLNQLSLIHLDPLANQAEVLLKFESKFNTSDQLANLLLDGDQALSSDVTKEWRKFVKALAKNPMNPKCDKLCKIMELVRQCGAVPAWMTLVFGSSDPGTPNAILDHCLQGTDPETLQIMGNISKQQVKTRSLRTMVPAFSDPARFDASWKKLKTAAEELSSPTLLADIKKLQESQNTTALLIAIQTLEQFIDLFDLSIKSMKGSAGFTTEQKIDKMKLMLQDYSNLLYTLTESGLVNEDDFGLKGGSTLGTESIQTIMEAIKSNWYWVSNSKGESALKPSQGFNVSGAVLGSAASIGRSRPKSLEDHFTYVHQNLIAVCSALLKRKLTPELIRKLPISPLFTEAMNRVENPQRDWNLLYVPNSYNFLRFNISENRCEMAFCLPLRNHSMTLNLIWDSKTDQVLARANFIGEARGRWKILRDIGSFLHDKGEVILARDPEIGPMHLNLTFALTSENLNTTLINIDLSGGSTILADEPRYMLTVMGDHVWENLGRYPTLLQVLSTAIPRLQDASRYIQSFLDKIFVTFSLQDIPNDIPLKLIDQRATLEQKRFFLQKIIETDNILTISSNHIFFLFRDGTPERRELLRSSFDKLFEGYNLYEIYTLFFDFRRDSFSDFFKAAARHLFALLKTEKKETLVQLFNFYNPYNAPFLYGFSRDSFLLGRWTTEMLKELFSTDEQDVIQFLNLLPQQSRDSLLNQIALAFDFQSPILQLCLKLDDPQFLEFFEFNRLIRTTDSIQELQQVLQEKGLTKIFDTTAYCYALGSSNKNVHHAFWNIMSETIGKPECAIALEKIAERWNELGFQKYLSEQKRNNPGSEILKLMLDSVNLELKCRFLTAIYMKEQYSIPKVNSC